MTIAVNVTFGLYHYGPYLSDLADCSFVRKTFKYLSDTNCPGLGQYSTYVYVGLLVVSVAIMLSLIFWVVYARERRHRKNSKVFERLDNRPFYQKNWIECKWGLICDFEIINLQKQASMYYAL